MKSDAANAFKAGTDPLEIFSSSSSSSSLFFLSLCLEPPWIMSNLLRMVF